MPSHIPFKSVVLVALGGAGLFACSTFGVIASLLLDFRNARDLTVVAALTLAFPVFLVGIWSLRGAAISLWIYFVYQWLVRSGIGHSFVLSNPFDWWFGDTLAFAIALISIGALLSGRASRNGLRLADLYANDIS